MHIVINSISNLGFTAFFNIINEGKLNVVTAIMNDKTVPSSCLLYTSYLYMMSTRGTSFWELYYSDSIMTKGKYEVNAEFLAWAE